jgi:tetratricopeptide (TPR) repeat protein
MMRNKALLTTAVITVLVACAPQTLIVRQMTSLLDKGVIAFERDSNLDLVEKAIPANIKLMEAMLANDPADDRLATLISRLYGSYGFVFIETRLEKIRYSPSSDDGDGSDSDALKAQLNRIFEKGMAYAMDALEKRTPGAQVAFAKVTTIAPYLARLEKADAAPLFWYGFNLGAWVNRNMDSIRAVSRAHVARQVMERVLELDPDYHYGGAHLFLLAYFGSRSPMMGGDMDKAQDHYNQLKQIAGDDYLLADLFYGRFCLQQRQDRDGFMAIMQRIIDQKPADDNMALYNAIAARRAQIYMAAADRLFE